MPLPVTNATASWSAGTTLTADEVWQVIDGTVFLETDATNRSGHRLARNQSLRVASGKTVYYRLASGTSAIIHRVAV